MKKLIVLATMFAAVWSAGVPARPPEAGGTPALQVTTVFVVRHAEKANAPQNPNPPLAPEGEARAGELARVLKDANVAAIYSTPTIRTLSTATPLAKALGIEVTQIKEAADTVKDILGKYKGKTVLVVGHSNTIPDILKALGAKDVPSLIDSDYDNLFEVTIAGGVTRVTRLHYGAANPVPATR